jgi:hypothetical protein
MDALIGYTGFVGGNLIEYMSETTDFYNSLNIDEMRNKNYNVIYCAGLYAEKWRVNKFPEDDISNINKLKDVLATVQCKRFILISTIDVLDTSYCQYEIEFDIIYNKYAEHSYGRHRKSMEEWCETVFKDHCYIFRLPALFGKGLKKNSLYDLIHNNNIHLLRSHWNFQWYNIEWLFNDINIYVSKNIKIVNLVTSPIKLGTIQKLLFPDKAITDISDNIVEYNVKSLYYNRSIEDIIISMKEYIDYKLDKKIVISELGWPYKYDNVMYKFLNINNIKDVEAVPSRNDWNLDSYNNIYSIQSLLYNLNLNIFNEQELFLDVLHNLVKKAVCKNTKVLIFGSPKNRVWNGEEYMNLFRKVGDIVKEYNIIFCIENNSKHYGCNWMTTFNDTYNFVKELNHPNIKINLDIGNLLMENETLDTILDTRYIEHVQLSFPNLGYWNIDYEEKIINELRKIYKNGYNKYLSLEIKYNNKFIFSDVNRFIKLVNLL